MSRFSMISSSLALAAVLAPAPLWADVTPDDVWQNLQDYLNVFGGELRAETSKTSDGMAISGLTYALDLPLDAGRVEMDLDGVELKDMGDGTVEILHPAKVTYGFSYSGPDGMSFTGGMNVLQAGLSMRASGNPGDVTYVYSADRIDLALQDVVFPEGAGTIEMSGFVQDLSGQDRITIGDLVQVASQFTLGDMAFDTKQSIMVETGDTAQTTSKSSGSALEGTTEMSLPRNGMDIMNLASALRDGLKVQTTYKSKDYFVEQDIEAGLSGPIRQVVTAATYDMGFALNADGLTASGTSTDIDMDMQLPDPMPLTISLQLAESNADLAMPMLESAEMAPVALSLEMLGLTVNESIWAMFDPGQALPRDAADLVVDLSGEVTNNVEWLDILNVEAALQGLQGLPVEMQNLSLNRLYLSAAGAEVSGKGAMSFDNSDLVSFGGFPRPEGELDFEFSGVNGLIDTLVAMGLVPEDQAMGARMGLAMMTAPMTGGGEDLLQSKVEINAQGHVLVNGNRMK